MLIAYAQYEPIIGYVQGMNFIAASLFYHASEVCTFWLLIEMMENYSMKDIFRQGLPGLALHDKNIDSAGRALVPQIFQHFVRLLISLLIRTNAK